MRTEDAARGARGPGWRELAGTFSWPDGESVANGRRQVGSGMARNRARARLTFSCHGQLLGRWRVSRRAPGQHPPRRRHLRHHGYSRAPGMAPARRPPCRLDRELCACGVRRWVDQNGTPATPWRFINLGTKPGGNEGAAMVLRAPPKSALDGLIKVDPVKRLLTRRFRSRRCIYSTVPRPSGGRHHCP